jgi:predicted alpha/beta superfamily hydrolase
MKSMLTALLFGMSSLLTAFANEPIALAEQFTLESKSLNEARRMVVVKPEGYKAGSHRYPVLYVLDGVQNIYHVAGSVEVLTRTGQIPPILVVGIESTNRTRDFTPSKMDHAPYSGGANRFLQFLEKELIPHVDKNYRTHPFRVLEGHSLSGLFCTFALTEKPDLFQGMIVISPALWWNGEEMTRRTGSFLADKTSLNHRLYFGIGTNDGWGMRKELERLVAAVAENPNSGIQFAHREFEGEGHMSAPLLVNYHGLKFIFAEMLLPDKLRTEFDLAAFKSHEAMIRKKYGSATKQSGEIYVPLGFELVEKGKFKEAVAVFERNAEAYSEYPPSFAWLADAQLKTGDNAGALVNYKKALEVSSRISFGQEDAYRAKIEALKESKGSNTE